MAKTYEPISTVTATNNSTTILSFTGIPSTYTELSVSGSFSFYNTGLGGSNRIAIRLNDDTTNSNYWTTAMRGQASGYTNAYVNGGYPGFYIESFGFDQADGTGSLYFDIMGYKENTWTAYRSGIYRSGGVIGTGVVGGFTPHAAQGSLSYVGASGIVNKISILAGSDSFPFKQNSTFTLYGTTAG